MGIIKRQGIKSSIVNYLGAMIGAVSVLFIYPLDDEIYGYAQWLYNTAFLLIPMASFGFLSIMLKYFPNFNTSDSKNYNGFLSLILLLLSGAFLLFLGFWYFFKSTFLRLLELLNMKAELVENNEIYILLLLAFLILGHFLTYQSANRLRIVVPNMIQVFGFKLFLPLLVLAYVYLGMTQTQFAYGMVAFFGVATLLIFIYLNSIKGIAFGRIKKPSVDFSYKEMGTYSIFGSLNQLSSGFAMRIDSIMIPFFLEMVNNGFYNKTLFITNIIEIPTRSINQIAGPIIAKAWKENDLQEINTVYKKASTNLFVVGSFVFLAVWYALDDLISISADPNSFPDARMIFLLLGCGKLVDMITSVNTQIIIYSKKYKYNLIFLVLLAISNVILNLKLIPEYGIVGAAIATTISLVAYNLIKIAFIYLNYGFHPFTKSTFKTLVLLLILALIFYAFPTGMHPLISIVVKLTFISILFLPIAYFWRISDDINDSILSLWNKYLSKS